MAGDRRPATADHMYALIGGVARTAARVCGRTADHRFAGRHRRAIPYQQVCSAGPARAAGAAGRRQPGATGHAARQADAGQAAESRGFECALFRDCACRRRPTAGARRPAAASGGVCGAEARSRQPTTHLRELELHGHGAHPGRPGAQLRVDGPRRARADRVVRNLVAAAGASFWCALPWQLR